MDNVAAACEFARVSSRAAAGIEDLRSRQNLPVNQLGGDHGAFLLDWPVTEQIEGPGVFSVERTTKGVIHLDVVSGPKGPHQMPAASPPRKPSRILVIRMPRLPATGRRQDSEP